MTTIINIGMNHDTAPVELREQFTIQEDTYGYVIKKIIDMAPIKETMVLSTCNRVEVIFTTDNEKSAKNFVINFLSDYSGIEREKLLSHCYINTNEDAMRHIFKVGASLDSMVIGEPQILGQLKEAYRNAVKHKASSVILNRLMHRCFSVAKKIRTETGISESPVSISFAAVELAKKIFGDLHGKSALLIGAGEMAELAAAYLLDNHISEIFVANRTFSRAMELAARLKGTAVSFGEIDDKLHDVDIVITSTTSPEPIIVFKQMKSIMRSRKNRPLFFIDIAVPRDVDSHVNTIDNIFVYNIDDLKGIVENNINKRKGEAARAERIVDEAVITFSRWIKTLEVVPTIVALQDKCEDICQSELKKSIATLGELSEHQIDAIENMARSIAKKILNDPILFLKRKEDRDSRELYLDFVRQLFSLDPDNGEKGHK